MTPVYRHGWGLDRRLWDGVQARLGGVALDRGYFEDACEALPDGPLLLVGHSLGALLWLEALPAAACALVVINGFDRLAAAPGWPGVPARVLDRMRARFAGAPAMVLADFLERCGHPGPMPAIGSVDRLAVDLDRLAASDLRDRAATLGIPVLLLNGSADPIVPPDLQPLIFGGAPRVTRATRPGGGHLLPASDPAWCGEAIRAFVGSLA